MASETTRVDSEMTNKKIKKYELGFLEEVYAAFLKRKKAISKKMSSFSICKENENNTYYIRVFGKKPQFYVNLYLFSDKKFSCYITSAKRANRGKVYFRIDENITIKNGEQILDCFEEMIPHLVSGQASSEIDWEETGRKLNDVWKKISVEVV